MIRAPFDSGRAEVTTMEVTPVNTVARGVAEVEVRGGVVRRLPEDHVFVAVTGRHGQDRKPFVGVMKGLGLRSGAHGSTVAHDSHNLIVAGTNPADMLLVAHTLAACGGGFCLADEGEVLARVELPIAGLMAREPVEELGPKVAAYNARVADLGLHSGPRPPILSLSGLTLTVIPEVRISDLGLVDVANQELIPLFAGAPPSRR